MNEKDGTSPVVLARIKHIFNVFFWAKCSFGMVMLPILFSLQPNQLNRQSELNNSFMKKREKCTLF